MKLRPLAGYVLIEPMDAEQTTASGLVMPDKGDEKPSKGVVVAVGGKILHFEAGVEFLEDGHVQVPDESCLVKEGDTVIFHKWSGQDVKEGQKEYRLVQFKDLMGVYE